MDKAQLREDFQKVRRFLIVQGNRVDIPPANISRNLQLVDKNINAETLHAIAEAIRSGDYRDGDLIHDIMGLARKEVCFLPRIKSIADVAEFIES